MNYRFALASTAFLMGAVTPSVMRAQSPAVLHADVDRPTAAVSPTLYGLMTEEIGNEDNFDRAKTYDGPVCAVLQGDQGEVPEPSSDCHDAGERHGARHH